jgi:hypothetical protein
MIKPHALFLFALVFSALGSRADLILIQQASDTNGTHAANLRIHGDKLRMEEANSSMVVIIDMKTRDSFTLLTTNQTFLHRFGSEIRWQMAEEKKFTHGTNDIDFPPARPADTGKSEVVNGRPAEIYVWSGAQGLTETLWVDKNSPNYAAIQPELAKLDVFNDAGPHRNGQPAMSQLPGLVLRSESTLKGHTITNILVSVKLEPVDASLFELPPGYSPWKRPAAPKP